jgi:hypothetical protein
MPTIQLVAMSIAIAFGASSMAAKTAAGPSGEGVIRSAEEPIGTASMEPDGTIVLRLVARERGVRGEGVLRYAPSDPQYLQILHHVGPIKPGETRPVAPWPD